LAAFTLAREPGGPARAPRVSASFVDISDPIGDELRQELAALEFAAAEQLQHGDGMLIVQLTAEPSASITPILEIDAVPQRGSDCRWYIGCNRADLEKQFRTKVIEPYARAIDRAFLPGFRARTPLFQGLHALSTKRAVFRAADPGVTKTLRVITDGLVHTGTCSVYAIAKRLAAAPKNKGMPPEGLSTDRGCQAEMRAFPGNFRNTDVELFLIARSKTQGGDLQTHELVEWLERYFISGGARQVRLRRFG
jgi:hypothetical protein